jgi:hypothetical protein
MKSKVLINGEFILSKTYRSKAANRIQDSGFRIQNRNALRICFK